MPAIISKNANTGGSGLLKGSGYDSGNIVVSGGPGKPPVKQSDGTQQSATKLTDDATLGVAGNYLEPVGQNNEKSPATITAVSYSGSTLTVTAANNFSVGQNIELNGLTTNTVLNRLNVVVATLAGSAPNRTGFTATVAGLTISNGADTGTATYTNQTRGAGLSLTPSN